MPLAYYFVGFNRPESIKVVFKSRESIFLASTNTNMFLRDVSDKFYDNPTEKEKCMKITDDEFDYYVKLQFARNGYKFIEKKNE